MESETKCAYIPLKMRLEERSRKSLGFMHKVPRELRDVNKKAYEPEMLSIGPNYHGRVEFKKMEEIKVNYMSSLLTRKPAVTLEDYYKSIEPVVQSALDCYGEAMSFERDEFIDMLVLDGCFLIQLIGKGNDTYNHCRWINSHLSLLQRDLLLLENQIPFFVLCKLFGVIQEPFRNALLVTYVLSFFGSTYVLFFGSILRGEDTPMRKPEEVSHILDLIHFKCSAGLSQDFSASVTTTSLLAIPSVSQLVEANVEFTSWEIRKDEGWRSLEFHDGKFKMKSLIIDGGTESVLRNFIAYEQMFPSEKDTPVTDHALLLNNLINDATDVQILSKCGIIYNRLGSDEAVADFVNRLTYKVIYQNKNFTYSYLFDCINTYYDKSKWVVPWNRAMSEFREKYFSSPWSFIVTVTATVLLLLTVAQTVFTAQDHFKRPRFLRLSPTPF